MESLLGSCVVICALRAVCSASNTPARPVSLRPPGVLQHSQASLPAFQSRFAEFLEEEQNDDYSASTASGFEWARVEGSLGWIPVGMARRIPVVGSFVTKVLEANLRSASAEALSKGLTGVVGSLGQKRILTLLDHNEMGKARKDARRAINRTKGTPANVWPVAWVENGRQLFCVVEELELKRCIGVHPHGEYSNNRIDAAICIIDLQSELQSCVLPLKLFELKARFHNVTLENSFKQLCISGYTALAHRDQVQLMSLDRKRGISGQLEAGSFDGRVQRGVISKLPAFENSQALSACVADMLVAAARECNPGLLPEARTKGLWGGLRASGNAVLRGESRYGSVWELQENAGAGRLIKLVTRLHDCQHELLAGGLEACLQAASFCLQAANSCLDGAIQEVLSRELEKKLARLEGTSETAGTPAQKQTLEKLEQLRLWLENVSQRRGRVGLPPVSGFAAADEAARNVSRFASILNVYYAVEPTTGYTQIDMRWCGHSVLSPEGFQAWSAAAPAGKTSALRALLTDVLSLCEVGWVHWDCRLENIVVSEECQLSAIDFDWVIHPYQMTAYCPAASCENLWYSAQVPGRDAGLKRHRSGAAADRADSANPKLYVAWQAYLICVLLLKAPSREVLRAWLDLIACGSDSCGAGDYSTFVQNLVGLGWNSAAPADAAVLAGAVLAVAERRLQMPMVGAVLVLCLQLGVDWLTVVSIATAAD